MHISVKYPSSTFLKGPKGEKMAIDYFCTRKMGFEQLGLGSYYTRLPLSYAPANVSGIFGKMSEILETT